MRSYRFHIIHDDQSREVMTIAAWTDQLALASFEERWPATYNHGAWAMYVGGKRGWQSPTYARAAGDRIRRRSNA